MLGGSRGAVASATVTVMFTDIVGSTAMIDSLGDGPAEIARRTHVGLLRAALAETNGREVKNTGDGLMAVFASTQDAVRCAVAIERAVARHGRHFRPALEVRVGVHVGEAIEDEGDYFGATVNIARRLCDTAQPMQILASSVVRAVLGRQADVGFTSVGPLSLKGFADPVEACEVAWSIEEGEVRTLPAPLSARERLAFVGRRVELKALDAEWAEAASAGPRLVAVGGEAGIGKSRLAKEFAIVVREQGGVVLFGRCDQEPLLPFQPFVEALRDVLRGVAGPDLAGLPGGTISALAKLVPELGGGASELGADPAADRYVLFEAVRVLLARLAADAPLLFLVDDLQWADRPSQLLLAHLFLAAEPMPLLVVATYRDTEVPPPVGALLADLRRADRLAVVAVEGLEVGDVAELLEGTLQSEAPDDWPKIVRARTSGNPLFVRELLREAADGDPSVLLDDGAPVPDGLRAIIRRRLSRLQDRTQAVLTVAAVVGSQFDVETVGRACDLPRVDVLDALDEAQASREIAEVPGEPGLLGFSHALVRRSLYAELPRGRRAELHRRVGEVLERLRGDDPAQFPVLAHHFTEAAAAGVADKAVTYAGRAGEQAVRAYAYEEAVAHYQRAVVAAGQCDPDPVRTAGLLVGLGRAATYTGDMVAARDAYRRAFEEAGRVGEADLVAAAALGMGQAGPGVGRMDAELVDALRTAVAAVAGTASEDRRRAELLSRLARELFGGGARSEADQLSIEALDAARRSGDARATALALNARRQCLNGLDNLERRLGIDREILSIAEEVGDRELGLTAWASLVIDHLRLSDIASVTTDLAMLSSLAAQVRHVPRIDGYVLTYRAMQAHFAGDLAAAEALADEALAVGSRSNNPDAPLNHAAQIVAIRMEQGRLGELAPIINAFAADPDEMLAWRLLQVQSALEAGDVAEAGRLVAALDQKALLDLPVDDFWLFTCSLAAEAVAAVGHRGLAPVLYELLVPAAGHNIVVGGGVVASGSVDRHLGLLASSLGEASQADAWFRSATSHNDAMGAVLAGINARLDWAQASAEAGEQDRATVLATEALERAEAAGLHHHASRAQQIAAFA